MFACFPKKYIIKSIQDSIIVLERENHCLIPEKLQMALVNQWNSVDKIHN